MLQINTSKRGFSKTGVITVVSLALLITGSYLLLLVGAPTYAPYISKIPIDVAILPAPKNDINRIVIPKIGVNIAFAPGEESLDKGAQWRYPERGNPEKGGNFIIAAHRFSIQPTPQDTIEKSPFYGIDKLQPGDKIVVDYNGTRYGYEINGTKNVESTDIGIEDESEEAKLTLYSCELDGSTAGRIVLLAKPLGTVALTEDQLNSTN